MKPERIQEEIHVPGEAADAIQDFLDTQEGWRLSAAGHRLERHLRFLSPRVAAAFTQFAAEASAALENPCSCELRGSELRIIIGSAAALTSKDLELAEAISLSA